MQHLECGAFLELINADGGGSPEPEPGPVVAGEKGKEKEKKKKKKKKKKTKGGGMTALHLAAVDGKLEAVQALLVAPTAGMVDMQACHACHVYIRGSVGQKTRRFLVIFPRPRKAEKGSGPI